VRTFARRRPDPGRGWCLESARGCRGGRRGRIGVAAGCRDDPARRRGAVEP